MTMHTTLPIDARDLAPTRNDAMPALAATHLAMIKRFAKFAAMVTGFFLLLVAVMSVKYAAFFPH